MMTKKFIFFILFLVLATVGFSQGSKRKGKNLFEEERYKEALTELQQYEFENPDDIDVKYYIGIAQYFSNNVEEAIGNLSYFIENEKSPPADVYFFLGRSYHSTLQYKKAIGMYKRYLKNIKETNINRPFVKDMIRRCAFGLSMGKNTGKILMENLGEHLNTDGDDFKPILSPNHAEKLYFSSIRDSNLGGKRDDEGRDDEENGSYKSDMFSAVISNGEWTGTTPLSYLLNGSNHDVLLDFSRDGSKMFFFKGFTLFSGEIHVDTFKQIEDQNLYTAIFESSMRPWEGDKDPYFFNDTILLFSSNREGSIGGFDLYISIFTNEKWTEPQNLGAPINTIYDETSPFLANNGRVLYFSTNNNKNSIGGKDVVKSIYNDASEKWSNPMNLGAPINSAGDEEFFRLTNDGYKAYLSSSRKTGFGARDLYGVYYNVAQREQLNISEPISFYQVHAVKLAAMERKTKLTDKEETVLVEKEDLVIQSLLYEADGTVLTALNVTKLNRIVNLMQETPEMKITLIGHSDDTEIEKYALFFSVKKAEKAAKYLVQHGIKKSRIILRGMGAAYPIAKNIYDDKLNPAGQRLNRRIDFSFMKTEKSPFNIKVELPQVADQIKENYGQQLTRDEEGLSYKIKIASIKQMYKGNAILEYPAAMVERNYSQRIYHYYIGNFKSYHAAKRLKSELMKNGIANPTILPFVEGHKINAMQARDLVERYSNLNQYFENEF